MTDCVHKRGSNEKIVTEDLMTDCFHKRGNNDRLCPQVRNERWNVCTSEGRPELAILHRFDCFIWPKWFDLFE